MLVRILLLIFNGRYGPLIKVTAYGSNRCLKDTGMCKIYTTFSSASTTLPVSVKPVKHALLVSTTPTRCFFKFWSYYWPLRHDFAVFIETSNACFANIIGTGYVPELSNNSFNIRKKILKLI
jgi:hypothetical protein